MASNDIRDVLNLPADGLGPRPSKKQKVAAPRPNLKGLAREVQNLGGDNPIRLVPEASVYKKRRLANRKPAAKWESRPFKNSARDDHTLVLRHWKRRSETAPEQANGHADATTEGNNANGAVAENGEASNRKKEQAEVEDSSFAKLNVKVDIPEYNEEQYNTSLQSDEWTKDETDYLMEMVKDFDLRWPLIWDRYEYTPKTNQDVEITSMAVVAASKPRTMEDLKARYYTVAAVMMETNKPKPYMDTLEYALHQTMLNFNPDQERQRKNHAINIMNRSKEEAKEEESLLIEVKRIMARAEQTNQERLQLYERLDYTPVDADKISQFQDSAGLNHLLTILQTQSNARKKKTLTGPDGASPAGNGPHGQPSSAVSETAPSRRESIAAQSAGHRDSIGAEKAAPAGNRKGQAPAERRVLTDYEKQIYGVSQHERLSSGPTYRYERVNKLFAHKSNSQQGRITAVLGELGIPQRLHIATSTVVAEYEKLVVNVTSVVEMRKHKDKLLTDIKLEEAKKVERARARMIISGQRDGATDDADEKKPKNEISPPADTPGDKPVTTSGDSDAKDNGAAPATSAPVAENGESQADGSAQRNGSGAVADSEAADKPTPLVKQEEGTGTRPGSSGGPSTRTKRSASVLSGTSDKSAKRQRK